MTKKESITPKYQKLTSNCPRCFLQQYKAVHDSTDQESKNPIVVHELFSLKSDQEKTTDQLRQ